MICVALKSLGDMNAVGHRLSLVGEPDGLREGLPTRFGIDKVHKWRRLYSAQCCRADGAIAKMSGAGAAAQKPK